MEINFKFGIGDRITTGASKFEWEALRASLTEEEKKHPRLYGIKLSPAVLIIVQRQMEECDGGVQIHYLCSYFSSQGYVKSLFAEHELVAYPESAIKE